MTCRFCFNAYVDAKLPKTEEELLEESYLDTTLNDGNDFGSITVGRTCALPNSNPHQMYLNSGGGKATHLEVCEWYNGRWYTVGVYYPRFCPECGRELNEYEITERGVSFNRKENEDE